MSEQELRAALKQKLASKFDTAVTTPGQHSGLGRRTVAALETDCLADGAVLIEQVSTSNSLITAINRESNREFRRIQASGAICVSDRRAGFNSLQPNSLRNRTGNFRMRFREFSRGNTEI